MLEAMKRERVKGYLTAEGRRLVNGNGQEVILAGWGLGNWLLTEGYMWMAGPGNRFDRPRRIEAVIWELTGSDFAENFWREFRENYVTREDIRLMAELGYNSVRIPFNWRLFLEEEPGLVWKEEGFRLLDRCLDWCEEFGLYAFLDMHGAPGGQTGANIDDSIDDFPRLFTDRDSWDKAIALWEKLAARYADRWIVGGYDLLNEPLRPSYGDMRSCDHLLPELIRFYEEAVAAVRRVDKRHLLSIEGHHWATDLAVFHKRYDDNMVIHFHRYACKPDIQAYREFLELAEYWDMPLWLGETGENVPQWYAAMYPLSAQLGIGYNLWPWKKMGKQNSPLEVREPEGWSRIIDYTHGEAKPSYQEAQETLTQFLEAIRTDNCIAHPLVSWSSLRQPGCSLRGTDFDQFPGKGESFSGLRREFSVTGYRKGTGMCVTEGRQAPPNGMHFDSGWDSLTLELEAGEFACYTVYDALPEDSVVLELVVLEDCAITLSREGEELARIALPASGTQVVRTEEIGFPAGGDFPVRVAVNSGKIQLDVVYFNRKAPR